MGYNGLVTHPASNSNLTQICKVLLDTYFHLIKRDILQLLVNNIWAVTLTVANLTMYTIFLYNIFPTVQIYCVST